MYVVGITGASGVVYAQGLLEALLGKRCPVALIISDTGWEVLAEELGWPIPPGGRREKAAVQEMLQRIFGERAALITWYDNHRLAVPVASGSYPAKGMVVVPCSMGTAARLACGISSTLLERAADVMLKERRRLVVVPRETPLSSIHLENLLRLSRAGAVVLPAAPGFYHHPRRIEDLVAFMTGRILLALGEEQDFFKPWGEEG